MKVFKGIKILYQIRSSSEKIVSGTKMNDLPHINNAWLAVDKGLIHDFGSMESFDPNAFQHCEQIDLSGRMVLPTWVDSHTHLVFAAWRSQEFLDRLKGLSYQEIAARGGGILNSAEKLAQASEDELYVSAMARLNLLIGKGTGAIEIKSGYGLSTAAEIKMLRVIKRIKTNAPIPVKATFLGAHAFPSRFKDNPNAYVDEIIHEMLPQIAEEKLADYIDVFCEKGYFDLEQTAKILDAGKRYGLVPKVHVNQFNAFGGVGLSIKYGARSVDHLEELNQADIESLANAESTIAVGLPGCSFFLGIPYTPVRELMAANIPVALATDFNPGSSPDGNMNFVLSLACTQMKMLPEEAINAMTLNGAAAIDLTDEVGSISKGKRANFIVTEPIEDLSFMPYAFAHDCIERVYINGEVV